MLGIWRSALAGMDHSDPAYRAYLQGLADAAKALILLDSARQYGLVTGGPAVSVAECEAALAHTHALGIEPNLTAVGMMFAASVRA